jgi:hypothetical protein
MSETLSAPNRATSLRIFILGFEEKTSSISISFHAYLFSTAALNSFSNSSAGIDGKETRDDLPRVPVVVTSVFNMPNAERN